MAVIEFQNFRVDEAIDAHKRMEAKTPVYFMKKTNRYVQYLFETSWEGITQTSKTIQAVAPCPLEASNQYQSSIR